MPGAPSTPYAPWRFRFSAFAVLATLGLIGMGGLVTSHGVGMAVPDWPTTYGYNMFLFPISQWKGGIFYEHSHRLWASFVGLLTVILAIWIGVGDRRVWMKWLVGAAVVLVVFQGVLGGLRVVWFKDEIGIFHATLAQLFLVLLCAIALFSSRHWLRNLSEADAEGRDLQPVPSGVRRLMMGLTLLILAQLMLGASMRHQHAGLAVPDFPLAYGKIWPDMDAASVESYNRARLEVRDYNPVTAGQIALHMAHRGMALVILLTAAALAWRGARLRGAPAWVRRGTGMWLGWILLQALLGAATVWSNKAADVATLHVVLGAVSLMWGSMLVLACQKFSVDALRRVGHSSPDFSVRNASGAGISNRAGAVFKTRQA